MNLASFVLAAFLSQSLMSGLADAKSPKLAALKIEESHTVPSVEISGMTWRKDPRSGDREIVIVGDRDYKLTFVSWTGPGQIKTRQVDLAPLLAKDIHGKAKSQSNWESVFSDSTGRVFILRENPPEVQVLSSALDRVERKIVLKIPAESTLAQGWDRDLNAQAEGLTPLSNGHILVVKEKDPLRIIEFAPNGAKASGYKAGLSLERGGVFPLPSSAGDIEYVPVAVWEPKGDLESLIEDASGLNVGPDEELFLLSDQRGMIGRIGKTLKPGKSKIKIAQLWSLPSELKQPEALAFGLDGQVIVAIDTKKTDRANFFVLKGSVPF